MREILFRGKRKGNNFWIRGDLVRKNNICYIYIGGIPREVEPETVGQYTGIKDKNGVKIFEGDIVKVYDVYCNETVVGVVEFCDGSFRIYDTDFTSYDRWMYYKVEVIGNIYDNPELVK